jgi:hypothetical protein
MVSALAQMSASMVSVKRKTAMKHNVLHALSEHAHISLVWQEICALPLSDARPVPHVQKTWTVSTMKL